ncbi:MAG: tRNA (guanosine(37)-N1)-methyltransferase TrmD [Nocardioidaceae bacterium]
MRVDVVSIFPDYLAPLDLSLVGKARESGLLDLRTHDLRQWTHDRHRTVDDTPYGGGAGMVMRPEPWGEALDDLVPSGTERPPRLLVLTPSGRPFTQAAAEQLAAEPWLVLACGRYEGIDERVVSYARTRMPVEEISVGDYVLNGGEVAALVVIEAVARLLPGFLGNPESLAEESHATGGLLEYPVYTKPPLWRGLDVPEVLLSGDHGRVARWRQEQALRRTAARRPDLVSPSEALGDDVVAAFDERLVVTTAVPADAAEILTLQRCCWVAEAQANDALDIPPLVETLADVRAGLDVWTTVVVRLDGRLVGSVRWRRESDTWVVGRLMVVPDLHGRGLGGRLLEYAEGAAPDGVSTYSLITGASSDDNLRRYGKAGYRPLRGGTDDPGVVLLTKPRRS